MVEYSIALAIAAACLFGTNAVIIQTGTREGSSVAAAVISSIVSVVAFWTLVYIRQPPLADVTLLQLAPFFVAGIAYPALFRLFFFEGIARTNASLSVVIKSVNPALAAILAVVVLAERPEATAVAGLVLIVVGVVGLQSMRTGDTLADGGQTDLLVRTLRTASVSDLLYPVMAMVIYVVGSIIIKYGLDRLGEPLIATAVTQTTGLVVFGVYLATSRTARTRLTQCSPWAVGVFALSGVVVALAWLAQFFALQLGTIVTVVPIFNISPLVVMGIAYVQARELPRSPTVISAILLVLFGGILIQI
ncbi:EamA family transporter [Haloferax sp. DFSO52]|uniref:DMT family transporter n=1 Tax=Haloferax sp. DFSO52 TaxID=3388505 RepID=UPI003A848712